MIVQRLRQIQDAFGYLPDKELVQLAREINVPLYQLQEVAGFFPHFRQEWNKPPYVEVKVCRDMACHLAGVADLLHGDGGLKRHARSGEQRVEVEGTSCLGRCDRAPVVSVSRHSEQHGSTDNANIHDFIYAGRTSQELHDIVGSIAGGRTPPPPDWDATYAGIDRSSWQIDVYQDGAFEPYAAIKAVSSQPAPVNEPHPFLRRLELAGLLGMGGAGVPAYRKWYDVWQAKPAEQSNDKYVVCNGDESEPATFKDREILLHFPHLVVEGVILAGLMTGATAGYIYIRHEYGEQIKAVRDEIRRAESVGACGKNIFGSGRDFPVDVFVSPGGYICGEQSALLEAMEDKRSQPRNRPPELSTNGLRDRPTVVNNVETLAWTPAIMLRGGEWYASEGLSGFKGRRIFSVCGDLNRPGVFETPIGETLGSLIERAGGVRNGKRPKAIATSGPSGGFFPSSIKLPTNHRDLLSRELAEIGDKVTNERMKKLFATLIPDEATHLDLLAVPLDKGVFGILAAVLNAPLMLGAGLAVYGESADILEQAVCSAAFFRNESCGKCVPCRIGSQKLVEIGTALLDKRKASALANSEVAARRSDVIELRTAMTLTSICGLGQVACNPMATALSFFDDEIVLDPGAKHG